MTDKKGNLINLNIEIDKVANNYEKFVSFRNYFRLNNYEKACLSSTNYPNL